MLLIGVAIGTGVGILISKPKIDKQNTEIDLLVTQMQTAKAESEGVIERAAAEIARKENELARMKVLLTQTTTKLANISAELKEAESRGPESPVTSEPEVVITTANDADKRPSTVPTTDYIIEDGDSFWKIAQEHLGDGNRYTEILRLNPTISEDQTLIIGTKIKIPAQ
jgi:nucleoid-associated protein YgaU